MISVYEKKEWKFTTRYAVSHTGKISYVVQASGNTIDELEQNLREAIARIEKIKKEKSI